MGRRRCKEKRIAFVEMIGDARHRQKQLPTFHVTYFLAFVLQIAAAAAAGFEPNDKSLQHRAQTERDHDLRFSSAPVATCLRDNLPLAFTLHDLPDRGSVL